MLDRKGEAPEVADPADNVNFVLAKEEADRLQTNEIVLQFLAYSRQECVLNDLYREIMLLASNTESECN